MPIGHVHLVGAGPGDPDLLTVKAARLLANADVVVYDRLVGPAILDLIRPEAERHYAGKRNYGNGTAAQEAINQTLIDLARQGRQVIRLKGGDPFIFGRGGEELEALAAAGIPFSIVPGITAATGCAAAAGIPLTHRRYAQRLVFATGQRRDGQDDLDWQALAQPRQTLVFYMGLLSLDTIVRELLGHGLPASTPVAIIRHGTLSDQKIVTGNLTDIASRASAADIAATALVIVGEAVRLRETLMPGCPAAANQG